MYTYHIACVSEKDNWIFICCNEEDSRNDYEPFAEIVKHIAKKWNNNEWKGNISSVGDMRYKVKNDPVDFVYQWDSLFGIVFEYKNIQDLNDVKCFLADNYEIY